MFSFANVELSGRKGPTKKTMLPRKTPDQTKTFDSSISPSGLLERVVRCDGSYIPKVQEKL